VNLVERAMPWRRRMGRFLGALLLAVLAGTAVARCSRDAGRAEPGVAQAITLAAPITSSNFVGFEDPLSENGAWAPLVSMAPDGVRFQKNNGAYANRYSAAHANHAGARTTVAVPTDHYSEIVVGHVAPNGSYVGPFVRVQTSGPSIDSGYLWWGTQGAANSTQWAYRMDANGTSYTASPLIQHPPFVDGDRVRLIARGSVLYGIRNGVREFIYNTSMDPIRLSAGTAGMLAFVPTATLTDAIIASWSTGAAPASSGAWASSTFAGTENPLDEGDRWYPMQGQAGTNHAYSGFKKAGGLAIGLDAAHNASGVWSIAPPAKQYSEVTLGTVASGGGGPIVRIDRTNAGQTGWLLFLYASSPGASGIYKLTPDGNFTSVYAFAATIVAGDKWRLTADGNTLTVSRNGVVQFTYTTDGSYPTGDVGIEAYTPAFTFAAWEGGDPAGNSPTITGFTPTSGPVGTSVAISGTNFTGATAVAFNGVSASFTVGSATSIQAIVPAGATTGPLSVTTPAGTATSSGAFTVVLPPTLTTFTPSSGPVGTSVAISGTNFTGATAVAFNGVSASFTVVSDTSIQATVPAGATTGPLSVTTPAGTATGSGAFTVVPPPTIASFTPASGPVGTSVTISGTNFTGATAVAFNGVSASFTVGSDTSIQATVPAGATTGPLGVTTPAGTATTPNNFTVSVSLAVTKAGTGSGSVTSSPALIDCGATCSAYYDSGTVVILTATPDTGSDFTRWDGCDTISGATCTVTMNAARSVTGTFTKQRFPLNVAKTGLLLGSGTVTSTSSPASPNQINCGSTCSASYDYGTVVTLTARPSLLSLFNGWSGCDTSSGTTCKVNINTARSVTAHFLP